MKILKSVSYKVYHQRMWVGESRDFVEERVKKLETNKRGKHTVWWQKEQKSVEEKCKTNVLCCSGNTRKLTNTKIWYIFTSGLGCVALFLFFNVPFNFSENNWTLWLSLTPGTQCYALGVQKRIEFQSWIGAKNWKVLERQKHKNEVPNNHGNTGGRYCGRNT